MIALQFIINLPAIYRFTSGIAFYFFPDVTALFGRKYDGKEIKNSLDLANFLLSEAHIAVVPGEAFNGPGKLRLSYANSLENLMEGMDRFAMAVKKLD